MDTSKKSKEIVSEICFTNNKRLIVRFFGHSIDEIETWVKEERCVLLSRKDNDLILINFKHINWVNILEIEIGG